MRIENYIEKTFGDKDIDYTLTSNAINRLSSRLCPFNGEPLSENKYVHVGKWNTGDTSYGVGLGGMTISNEYKIEAWYIRISNSFYESEKNRQQKLKSLNISLIVIALVSAVTIIYAIFYADQSNPSNSWLIAIVTFLGSGSCIMVLQEVKTGRVAKISKQVVQRTSFFPFYGIPPIDHNKLGVLIETDNIKEYVQANAIHKIG